MNNLKILNKNETKEVLDKLSKQFGIKKIPGILVKRGSERIFLFTGDYSKGEIKKLEEILPVERVGVYFMKIFKEKTGKEQIRLSIEGGQILQDQITKNIFELNDDQVEQWMMGQELNIESGLKDFVIMKYKQDFLGTGKASEKKISNFIPKNRRLKSKTIIN